MPIDLIPVTSSWLAAFEAHRRHITGVAGLLERWLIDRADRMAVLERRTRGFPVFAFEGRALSLVIDAQQHRALEPYRNAGGAWAAPFVAFGRGFTRIPQAVDDELILPNLLGAVEGLLNLVADSVNRLVDPRASTFNPANARFSDVFGLFAMAWRGLTTSTGQLRLLVGDIGEAKRRFESPTGAETAGSSERPGIAWPSARAEMLDDVGRWLAGAIAIIPAIPDWIQTIASVAWLRARTWVLDTFQGIESRVFELRRQVLGFILQTIPEMLREVPAIVAALATMMQWSLHYFALVARIYFEVAVAAVRRFMAGIHGQVNGIIDTINSVLSFIDRAMDFDLLNIIKPFMGLSGVLIDMMGIRFTLNDLIEVGTGAVNLIMYASLKAAILTARGLVTAGGNIPLVGRLPFVGSRLTALRRRLLRDLALIDRIVDALFRNTGGPMAETAGPRVARMPNFYDLMFGAPPSELAGMVRDFGGALGTNMRGLFEQVSGRLRDFGDVFTATAADLARTGPAGRMERFGREAGTLANQLYEDQVTALGERVSRAPIGPFERWLAGNGFQIIGRAIPLYIGEMRAWWNEQEARGDGAYVEITPTSPHKIARRARLGRVRVPRITLDARGRAHDETLLRELARGFHDAVRDAYASGHRQLAQIAAGPAR